MKIFKNRIIKKAILSVLCMSIGLTALPTSASAAYHGSWAADYARTWFNSYNPSYPHFNDADCTNFVSQCVLAGGGGLTFPRYYYNKNTCLQTDEYWYYMKYNGKWYRSSTWTLVAGGTGFYNYWHGTMKKKCLTYTSLANVREKASLGDVIQVAYVGSSKFHSTVVGRKTSDEIYLYYHTNNTKKSLKAFNDCYKSSGLKLEYTIIKMNS